MSNTTGYLILSHADQSQTERLARTIVSRSSRAYVLVAHDDRINPSPVVEHPRVRVWNHGLPTDWGSWELVQATLDGLRQLRHWASPDMVALASGQDYVCGDLHAWEDAFLSAGGWVGSAHPLSYRPRWGRSRGEGDDTWTRYHYRWFDVPALTTLVPTPGGRAFAVRVRDALFLRVEPALTFRVMRRAGRQLVGLRLWRGVPHAQGPIYKGQQMLAMDGRLLDHVLDRCSGGSPLVRHFRRTVIPDESLIQSVLYWDGPPRRDLILTHIGWDFVADGARFLELADLSFILNSHAALCRKVSSDTGGPLCDALDNRYEQDLETP